jgi:hypothetical protein
MQILIVLRKQGLHDVIGVESSVQMGLKRNLVNKLRHGLIDWFVLQAKLGRVELHTKVHWNDL